MNKDKYIEELEEIVCKTKKYLETEKKLEALEIASADNKRSLKYLKKNLEENGITSIEDHFFQCKSDLDCKLLDMRFVFRGSKLLYRNRLIKDIKKVEEVFGCE